MNRYKYTKTEREINTVLANQSELLSSISKSEMVGIESTITRSERILTSLGYDLPVEDLSTASRSVVPSRTAFRNSLSSWDELLSESVRNGKEDVVLEDLFSKDELANNIEVVKTLNAEYNSIHKLDGIDIAISVGAGLLAAAIETLLVGVPKKTSSGLKAGPLSDYIRDHIERVFTPEQIRQLERASKVPYDAPVNKGFTTTHVEGLVPGMHRLYSLGHDPLLGLVVGVSDILTGRMTTIDKNGKIVVQAIDRYANRRETELVQALIKQITHFLSDVTTPAGLPAPCMGLFNLMQFGSLFEEDQTIAEVVQGMYWSGYDFVHFCSSSIPVAVAEIFVRFAYAVRKIKSGTPIKDSIPVANDREKHPKLATMLFIAHSSATAINAGKVCFTQNPMVINYPQWMAFAKYSYQQLKWVLVEKPDACDQYVRGIIDKEMDKVFDDVDRLFEGMITEPLVV